LKPNGNFRTLPSLTTHLAAIRGKVRRLSKGVEKEQRELLALQIANRVPTPYLARQIALMGGRA
jgi:hypothetical protein